MSVVQPVIAHTINSMSSVSFAITSSNPMYSVVPSSCNYYMTGTVLNDVHKFISQQSYLTVDGLLPFSTYYMSVDCYFESFTPPDQQFATNGMFIDMPQPFELFLFLLIPLACILICCLITCCLCCVCIGACVIKRKKAKKAKEEKPTTATKPLKANQGQDQELVVTESDVAATLKENFLKQYVLDYNKIVFATQILGTGAQVL